MYDKKRSAFIHMFTLFEFHLKPIYLKLFSDTIKNSINFNSNKKSLILNNISKLLNKK